MRIAVTGATGNVGTALLRTIGAETDVVGLVRRPPALVEPYDRASWASVDLASADSESTLAEIFSTVDVVVHLAVSFQPMRDRGYLERVNVGGTARVARACAAAGVTHLIHMSSGGIYSAGAYGVEVDEYWPRSGVPTSTYSMDKAAAELVLDRFESAHPEVTVARVRPGLIGQYEFGSALLRYALPDVVPSSVVDHLPVLPIDRTFTVPAVHSNDVADAVVRILDRRASGPFNLAAPTPVRADDVADALSARIVPTSQRVLSAALRAGFAVHVLPVHPGWVDLAFATPLLDSGRAERELGWAPSVDGPEVLRETVRGMRERAHAASPPMRKRTASDRVRSFGRRGFVSRGRPS
ncbi:NAD-dependent epimerase/dehydratase family protein [Rhodococcus sovatensis]|uniref:NAD-dependent epimerase/dehydratase family protein n=1 Tax=Rhodococcus sovatensis TaxID=1805840 RepID=A0ABZ2PH74_9NOCA